MIDILVQGSALDVLTIGREFGPFGVVLAYLWYERREMKTRLDRIDGRLRGVEEVTARNDERLDAEAAADD